jgi:hypothetical protein
MSHPEAILLDYEMAHPIHADARINFLTCLLPGSVVGLASLGRELRGQAARQVTEEIMASTDTGSVGSLGRP